MMTFKINNKIKLNSTEKDKGSQKDNDGFETSQIHSIK